MQEDEVLNVYNSKTKTGRFRLTIKSIETHSFGYDSGKMDERPGDFLETQVSIKNISKPSALEALAVEKRLILWENKKEITDEPEGYAKLKHDQIVAKVQKSPDYYLQDLRKAVKDCL